MTIDVKKVLEHYDTLKGARGNWENHWDELLPFVLPRKDFAHNDLIDGQKRVQGNILFDATAIHANELLASALHGMLTNPAIEWFELFTGVKELDEDPEVRAWLQESTKTIHDHYNDSNFQTEVHENYIDLGTIGTTILLQEENKDPEISSALFFRARTVLTSVLDEDEKGLVDTIYFNEKMTVKNLIQRYGEDNIPDEVKRNVDPSRKWVVIHGIFPKALFGADSDPRVKKSFKWASVHIIREIDALVKVGGFNEFPAACPRWTKLTGEIYGRSPAMKALPDITMLNAMKKTTIRSAQKMTDPPMQIPDDGVLLPLNVNPGGINYYRAGSKDFIEPLKTEGRVDFGIAMIDGVKLDIRQAFFIDQLQLAADGPQMTATEVQQRIEEKLRLLGPILGRQNFEFLRPLVNRSVQILLRKELLPPIPDKLRGQLVKVRYSSQIAKAQRIASINDLNRAMELILPMIQLEPTLMDVVNGEKLIRVVGSIFDIPAEILNNPQTVKMLQQQRQEFQQQQIQAETDAQDVDNISKLAGASKER